MQIKCVSMYVYLGRSYIYIIAMSRTRFDWAISERLTVFYMYSFLAQMLFKSVLWLWVLLQKHYKFISNLKRSHLNTQIHIRLAHMCVSIVKFSVSDCIYGCCYCCWWPFGILAKNHLAPRQSAVWRCFDIAV